jgi:hypothetical protein
MSLSLSVDPPCLNVTGTVRDQATNNPLVATIYMQHKGDKTKMGSLSSLPSGLYRIWVPAKEEIEATVSAKGYADKVRVPDSFSISLVKRR